MTQWLKPHLNIARVFSGDDSTGVINMEYCSGGDLHDQCDHLARLQSCGIRTPEAFQVHVFISLILGLAYVHHGIRVFETREGLAYGKDPTHLPLVHGDLKPGNILLKWPGQHQHRGLPDVVLTDFGLCRPARYPGGVPGDPDFRAPEVQAINALEVQNPVQYRQALESNNLLSRAADVYSLGLCMTMLMGWSFTCGTSPYLIEAGDVESLALLQGIRACLEVDRANRIQLDDGSNGMLHMFLHKLAQHREGLLQLYGPLPSRLWASPPV